MNTRTHVRLGALALFIALGGCSSSKGNIFEQSGGGSGGGGLIGTPTGGSDPSGGGSSNTAGGSTGGPGSCPITVGNTGCVGEVYVGENIPLDIYIMFDQSGSMLNDVGGMTRMEAVRRATNEFLLDDKSAGIGVGIGYFGYQPIGMTSCDPVNYQNAAVGVAPLPGNAQPIIDSLAGIQPTGETPTGAAIRGACTYASSWKQGNPGRAVVILLVTDGKPEAPLSSKAGICSPTLEDAVQAATSCLQSDAAIRTYVLGVGPYLGNLGQIAEAGGTKQAYLVESGDVTAEVLAALNRIRGDASIPCQFKVPRPPEGETLDLGQVNLVFTDTACQTRTIYYVEKAESCDANLGGWFYDNPASPQSIQLCGRTCDDVSVPGSQFLLSVGCTTVVSIR
jgi:Mg-chelatase subunit ChlD